MDIRKVSFIKSLKELPTIMTFLWEKSTQSPQIPNIKKPVKKNTNITISDPQFTWEKHCFTNLYIK